MRHLAQRLVAISALAIPPVSVFAQSPATTTLSVSANVVASCEVTAGDLAFGEYRPLDGMAQDGSAQITVKCTLGTPYEIGLNLGSHQDGSTRRMSDGSAHFLEYALFKDAAYSEAWTESTPGLVSGNGTGLDELHTVYGRIPAAQVVSPGSYSDTVNVNVTF